MKNIVLIGMMGSGKTTCGLLLAGKLGRELVDTDALIVEREGRSIPDIFAQSGEDRFRALEEDLARELARREDLVIACGGGLPLRPGAIGPLRETGEVVFLARDPGETYDSVSMAGRPLAQDGRAAFLARFRQREPVYRASAHHVVEDFSSLEQTAKKILEVLEL